MQFSVPEKWIDWLNVDVWLRVRRIDIIIGVCFAASIWWGWWTHGWRGIVVAALGFALMTMYALWTRPPPE